MTTSTIPHRVPSRVAFYIEGMAYVFRILSIAALFAAAALLHTGIAHAQEATPQAGATEAREPKLATVTPAQMTSGGLLFKTEEPGKYVQAPLVATNVELDVTGIVARGTVTQRFYNPTDGWVEGIYVFPLPDDSAVDTLKMQIGDRFIEGKIKEKREAREIYEKAKEEGFKASLVEQERPNMFTNSVANIGPGEVVVVQIAYQETVQNDAGTYAIRFPMVVAPRYMPEPTMHMVDFTPDGSGFGVISDPVPDRDRISPPVLHPDMGKTNPVKLTVNLDAGFDLGEVKSHHHKIKLDKDGDHATLSIDGVVPADKDFELTWTPKEGEGPTAGLFIEEATNADGTKTPYLLMMLTPPTGRALPDAGPREVVFVIDNSGSMSGPSMQQAKESLLLALDRLDSDDTFNVIRFDDTMDQVFSRPVRAEKENVQKAATFVAGLEANGGTEMLPALQAALTDPNATDASRLRQVVFLTDGAIGNEVQLFETIAGHLGRSRLFTVGIGSAPNSFFMTRAAELGRGAFTHIGSATQVKDRMADLFEKLETPVITSLETDWPRRLVNEMWPNPLPDLYKGEPIVLTAKLNRMPKSGDKLELGGNFAGEPWLVQLPLARAKTGEGIAKLWARRKIASLEGFRYGGADWEKIDKQILAVALDHHLVSRLTSLVAVDVTPSRPDTEDLASADVPLNLPEGWDFAKVFGEAPQMRINKAAAPADPAYRVLKTAMAPPAPAPTAAGANLPPGATPAPLLIVIGAACLSLGLVLLLLWRREEEGAAA